MHRNLAVPAIVLCLIPLQAALGDGIILDGVSPRSIGRGGTNIGFRDNGAVIFDNPAGMANISGNGLIDIGVDVTVTNFIYSDPENPRSQTGAIIPLPQIAAVQRSADGMWAWGVGVFTPAGFSVNSHTLQGPPPFPGDQVYKSFGSLTKVLPALAVQVTDRLSVGGTLGVGITHAELEGPYFVSSLGGLPTLFDLQGTGAALVWSAGMQYDLSDDTTIGLTYQSSSRFKLDGTAKVQVPGMGHARYDADMRVTWPRSLGLGVRHRLFPRHTVSTDLIWFDWSAAFDDFALTLAAPDNPFFPPVNEHFPLDWRDTLSVRTGYEWELERHGTMRLGYIYHRVPSPTTTITPFIPGALQHGFSCGYGFKFREFEIDLSYVFLFGSRQYTGQSALVGGDFDNSMNRAQAHAASVNVIKRF